MTAPTCAPDSSAIRSTLPSGIMCGVPWSDGNDGASSSAAPALDYPDEIYAGMHVTLFGERWTPATIRAHGFSHVIRIDRPPSADIDAAADHHHAGQADESSFGRAGVQVLDLQFGTVSYMRRVLPNCYKAVTFIERALSAGGSVLLVDQLSPQKAVTLVVGFLMYKHHIKFTTAFQRVKAGRPAVELDAFYRSQLYEYEPILQVQRAQQYGHSCSREIRCSLAKRKVSCISGDDLMRCDADGLTGAVDLCGDCPSDACPADVPMD